MKPGDIYIEAPRFEVTAESGDPSDAAPLASELRGRQVQIAIDSGACAVMVDQAFEPDPEEDEDIEVPLMLVKDTVADQQRLAVAFYDHPSTRMKTVGITGQLSSHSRLCLVHSTGLGSAGPIVKARLFCDHASLPALH